MFFHLFALLVYFTGKRYFFFDQKKDTIFITNTNNWRSKRTKIRAVSKVLLCTDYCFDNTDPSSSYQDLFGSHMMSSLQTFGP